MYERRQQYELGFSECQAQNILQLCEMACFDHSVRFVEHEELQVLYLLCQSVILDLRYGTD